MWNDLTNRDESNHGKRMQVVSPILLQVLLTLRKTAKFFLKQDYPVILLVNTAALRP
jgi:hypothetical protein